MTTESRYDATRPVDDRYTPPAAGELDELTKTLADGRLSGGAPVVAAYERALADWWGVARVIATNSGTSALHATLVALGVGPGDEVLVPATAPIVTAMPILTRGATPVIVDVAEGSLALDPLDVAAKLTDRTRAALTLPLWGYPADNADAATVLDQADVPIVEDACQAHGTDVRGRYAGTSHRAGCFSTHDRKLLSTGEGGFVATDDEDLADRIDHYTHLGHLKGEVHGVNAKLAAPLAAIGLARLPGLARQLAARRRNAAHVLDALPHDGVLRELPYGQDDRPNYYLLVLTAADGHAARLGADLAAAGLPPDSIRWAYRPLYHRPIFARYATPCPSAEALCARTFQLPVHPALPDGTLRWIADRIRKLAEGCRP